nr:MAG TPA: hypothetical protein [Caudoviricetes sp.]
MTATLIRQTEIAVSRTKHDHDTAMPLTLMRLQHALSDLSALNSLITHSSLHNRHVRNNLIQPLRCHQHSSHKHQPLSLQVIPVLISPARRVVINRDSLCLNSVTHARNIATIRRVSRHLPMRRAPRATLKHGRSANIPHATIEANLSPRPNRNILPSLVPRITPHQVSQHSTVLRYGGHVELDFLISQLAGDFAPRSSQRLVAHAHRERPISLISLATHRDSSVLWDNNAVAPRIRNNKPWIQEAHLKRNQPVKPAAPFTSNSHNTSQPFFKERGSYRRGRSSRGNRTNRDTRRSSLVRLSRRRVQERRHREHRRTTAPRTTTHSLLLILSQKHRTSLLLQVRIVFSLIPRAANSHPVDKVHEPGHAVTDHCLNDRRHVHRIPVRIPLMPN